MSAAGAECVSAPTETSSAPIVDELRGHARCVMLPESSTRARPPIRCIASAHRRIVEVVEHDDVGPGLERGFDVRETLRLDFNGTPRRRRARARDRFGHTPGESNVIVLDENAVVEPGAMIRAAAAAHGVLRQRAEPGRRLSRIEDADPSAGRVTNARVKVAIPERYWRKLSAVRSAVSNAAALPRTVASTSPGRQRSPSRFVATSSTDGIHLTEHLACDVEARQRRRRSWRRTSPRAGSPRPDDRDRRDIACTDVFVQRRAARALRCWRERSSAGVVASWRHGLDRHLDRR